MPLEGVWRTHGLGGAHGEADHDHDHADDDHHDHGDEPEHLGPPGNADIPGVPAVLVKPRTIANTCQIRGDGRTETTLAVFPAKVLTRLYSTLGDARLALTAIAMGAPRLAVFGIVRTEIPLLIGVGWSWAIQAPAPCHWSSPGKATCACR